MYSWMHRRLSIDYFDTKGTLKCDDSQASSSWFDQIMSQIVALVVLNYLNCLRLTLIHLLHLPLCATSDPQNLCAVFKLKIKSNCFKWKIASSPLDPQNGAPPASSYILLTQFAGGSTSEQSGFGRKNRRRPSEQTGSGMTRKMAEITLRLLSIRFNLGFSAVSWQHGGEKLFPPPAWDDFPSSSLNNNICATPSALIRNFIKIRFFRLLLIRTPADARMRVDLSRSACPSCLINLNRRIITDWAQVGTRTTDTQSSVRTNRDGENKPARPKDEDDVENTRREEAFRQTAWRGARYRIWLVQMSSGSTWKIMI